MPNSYLLETTKGLSMPENITKRAPKGNVRFSITLSEEQKLAKAQIRNHPFNFILDNSLHKKINY